MGQCVFDYIIYCGQYYEPTVLRLASSVVAVDQSLESHALLVRVHGKQASGPCNSSYNWDLPYKSQQNELVCRRRWYVMRFDTR